MDFYKRIDTDYIVTLLFLLLTANANFLSGSDIWWFLILVLMGILAISKKLIHLSDIKIIGGFSVAYLFFVGIRDLLVNNLDSEFLISEIVFLIKYVSLAFIFCVILKEKAIAYIVKVITHLTIVSLIFFPFQLLAGDAMYRLFNSLNLPSGNDLPGYTNVLLFTFTKDFHDYSNSGFVWEPGAYGCFLVIALMFRFFLNKFRFDKTAIILIIGNITTFSTTNYLGVIVLLFLLYRYRVPKINLWVLILIPTCAVLIVVIPFLGDKIIDTYNEDMRDLNHLKVLEHYYHQVRMQVPLNRFSSMAYIYNTFGSKLILGVSNNYNAILYKSYNVNISNGIFDFLAKFGLVGFLYLLYRYCKFCMVYVLNWEKLIYAVLILLAISFGEPVMILPIVLIFLFLPVKQTGIVKRRRGLDDDESEDEKRKLAA